MRIIKNKKIEQEFSKIFNLIYPPVCGICGKLNQEFLCPKCLNMLKNQVEFKIEKFQNQDKYFSKLLYFFKYEGTIRKIILKYKFQEKSYLYKTLVNFMLKNQKFFEFIQKYDTIVPVPISRKRYNQRGYNQSYLIAKEIANNTNLKVENNSLHKIKNIIEQSKLNRDEREKNIQGVYFLRNPQELNNKKVILLDDIYTTGSTANECSKTLMQANPKEIAVFTIAKD